MEGVEMKSIYVVMKESGKVWTHRDVHCVCESKKEAEKECDAKNKNARYNTYYVKKANYKQKENEKND